MRSKLGLAIGLLLLFAGTALRAIGMPGNDFLLGFIIGLGLVMSVAFFIKGRQARNSH